MLYRNFGPYVYQKNVDEKKKNRGGSRTMIMSTMWLLWLFSHPAMTVAVSCFTFSGIKLGYFERYCKGPGKNTFSVNLLTLKDILNN